MLRNRHALRAVVACAFLCVFGSVWGSSAYVQTLWIGAHHTLARLSASDGSILSEVGLGHHRAQALATDSVNGNLWLLNHRSLNVYDQAGQQIQTFSLPRGVHLDDDAHRGGMVVDHGKRRVWLAGEEALYRFDFGGNLLGAIKLHHFSGAIALETSGSDIWVGLKDKLESYDSSGSLVQTIQLAGHGHIEALTYTSSLSSLWVIQGDKIYRYSTRDGAEAADVKLDRDADDYLATDGSGSVWVAGKHALVRIDGSGALDFTLQPIPELHGHLVSLAVNPGDHSVWVVGKHELVHVGTDGTVLQSVNLNGDGAEDRHKNSQDHGGAKAKHLGPVDAAVVWADTIPPVLSFLKPPESAYVANTKPSLIFHYSDLGSGTNLSSLSLTVNGQAAGVSCSAAGSSTTPVPASGTATCSLASPMSQGGQNLSATVEDYAGNTSKPATRSFTVDTIPPTITITQPSEKYTNQPHLALEGYLSEAGTPTVDGAAVPLDVNFGFSDPLDLTEGSNTLKLVATDLAGNTTRENLTIILDTVPPPLPNLGLISISGPNKNGQVTVTGKAGAVEGGDTVTITDTRTGASVTVTVNADGSFAAQIAAGASDKLFIKVMDEAGNVTTDPDPINVSNLPPDPSQVAPVLSKTDATPFIEQVSFLYRGSNPIQTGVQSGAIKANRVAVIRGQVIDRGGNPLPGVTVSVYGHPELGKTISRVDGHYDLAVDGGGRVVLCFSKKNYLPAWRSVRTSWKDYSMASKVALIKEDPKVTAVSFGATAPATVASGSVQTGAAGTRRARIYFPAGTTAEIVMPDGTSKPITKGGVRATEYTVGSNGPAAMPANLPPTSAYTYAVGLTIDQAEAAGASTVKFNQPVPVYVNNYLGFPVGTRVPAGWYDVKKAEWMPIDDGRVIKLLDVNAQQEADLDVDGTGAPASTTTLAAMGITPAERIKLATLYKPGATFWRVPVTHFTVFDFNWWGALHDALGASVSTITTSRKSCSVSGCIITAQTQVVAEKIPVTGTPFNLYYSSGRQKGYAPPRTANITLTGAMLPSNLAEIDLEVNVAGQILQKSFTPKPNLTYTYTWNGLDAYGRKILGAVKGTVKITYVMPIQYVPIHNSSTTFAVGADGDATKVVAIRNDQFERVTKEFRITLSNNQVATASDALGGWNLSVHDSYDPASYTVYKGSGGKKKNACVAGCLGRFAGGGAYSVDGYPALETHFSNIEDLAQDSKGNIYLRTAKGLIRRISPAGTVETVLGGGSIVPADGVKASDVKLISNSGSGGAMSVGPQGDFYFIFDGYRGSTLFKIDGGDIVRLVADIPCYASALSMANDGSAYILCLYDNGGGNNILYRVAPGGSVNVIAKGKTSYGSLGGLDMAVCPNQDIFYYSGAEGSIKKITPMGGKGSYPQGRAISMSCGENGGLYIDKSQAGNALMSYGNGIVYLKNDGTYAKLTKYSYEGYYYKIKSNTLLGQNYFYNAQLMYSRLYHGLFISRGGRIWFVAGEPGSDLAGYSGLKQAASADGVGAVLGSNAGSSSGPAQVASSDGSMLYDFNARGAQTKTVDSINGHKIYSFGYNHSGQVISVTDANGNVTRIVRDSNGKPTEIIAPTGQVTSLSVASEGYLTSITDPAGDSYRMSYTSGGLIKSYTDPDSRTETYSYSALGRLTHNVTAAGGGWSISRTASGRNFTVTMQSAEGRKSSYQVANSGTGTEHQVVTAPDGTSTTTVDHRNGMTTVTAADGTISETRKTPDPRFDMQAPMPSVTILTPAGLKFHSSITRAATLASVGNPLSMTGLSQDTVINGQQFISKYSAAKHQWTATSPQGRSTVTTVDAQGRPLTVKVPALATVAYAYDSHGRLTSVGAGSGDTTRQAGYSYYTSGPLQGWLKAETDSMGRKTTFGYDAAGHVTSQTLPDGEVIRFGYDSVGNLTSVTPPSRPAHGMSYTAADALDSYTPPATSSVAGDGVQYNYNPDRQLTGITFPSGRNLSLQYNSSGQLTTMVMGSGHYQYGYSAKTGKVTSLINGADGESLGFAYDGFLPTQTAYSGPVSGTLKAGYNNNFQVTELSVDGTQMTYGYNTDGLLTQAGELAVSRNAQNGLTTGTTLGSITTSRSYDRFGEVNAYAATAGSSARYAASFTYNKDGEITAKSATVNGAVKTQSYGYDKNGRLTAVTQDGGTTTYGYDANGNRVSINGAQLATYNARDQLLTYGNNTYTWTVDGDLVAKTTPKGTTHYTWNALGELTDASLPDGTTIHYLYDGLGRRVGKEKNGNLVVGYLYAGSRIVAQVDAAGQVTERFVYATHANVPDYLITYSDGSVTDTYRIISNQVGSVREVIEISSGAVVQQIDYDVWGNITSNTSRGFQPFAFAGGLYDADTGLVHFGVRDYDPLTARWISRDPIYFAGGDPNLYRYALNDPVNLIDPSGRFFITGLIGGLIGAASAAFRAAALGGSFGDIAKAAAIGGAVGFAENFLVPGGGVLMEAATSAVQGFSGDLTAQIASRLEHHCGKLTYEKVVGGLNYGGAAISGLVGAFAGARAFQPEFEVGLDIRVVSKAAQAIRAGAIELPAAAMQKSVSGGSGAASAACGCSP